MVNLTDLFARINAVAELSDLTKLADGEILPLIQQGAVSFEDGLNLIKQAEDKVIQLRVRIISQTTKESAEAAKILDQAKVLNINRQRRQPASIESGG